MAVEYIRYGIRSIPSKTKEEARQRAIHLYREWLRLIPDIVGQMTLDISIPEFRRRIRLEFERNRHHSQLEVVNALIFKGATELAEMQNLWKQKVHAMYKLEDSASILRLQAEKREFLDNFFAGSL